MDHHRLALHGNLHKCKPTKTKGSLGFYRLVTLGQARQQRNDKNLKVRELRICLLKQLNPPKFPYSTYFFPSTTSNLFIEAFGLYTPIYQTPEIPHLTSFHTSFVYFLYFLYIFSLLFSRLHLFPQFLSFQSFHSTHHKYPTLSFTLFLQANTK